MADETLLELYEVLIPDVVEHLPTNRTWAISCKPECEHLCGEKELSYVLHTLLAYQTILGHL